jgi:hypothetical protein
MSSVVLAQPAVPASNNVVDLSESGRVDDLVEIVGVYPIYASERDFAYSQGFGALWNLPWDRFDPSRRPVVQEHY